MARGEQDEKGDRSVGVAIFAVFLVVCLFVAYLVADVWVVREPPPPPDDAEPGWRAPLTALELRDCGRRTRTMRHDVSVVEVDEELARRGYVPAGPWSDPSGFPLTVTTDALEGTCGVVAFVPQTNGTVTDATVEGASRRQPCVRTLTVAACGANVSAVANGWGEARSRVFVLPGVSDESELPPEVLLAHLEVESALGAVGWRASDAAWVVDIPVGGLTPQPSPPPTGCQPWIAVGYGTPSGPVSTWNHVPLGTSAGGDLFLAGVVRCAIEPSDGLTIDTGFPGTLTWRSYTPDAAAPRLERVVPTIPRVVRDESEL